MLLNHTTLRESEMVEPVAGLIPRPQVALVRKVDRKPTSREASEDKNSNQEEKRLPQSKLLNDKGAVYDILL